MSLRTIITPVNNFYALKNILKDGHSHVLYQNWNANHGMSNCEFPPFAKIYIFWHVLWIIIFKLYVRQLHGVLELLLYIKKNMGVCRWLNILFKFSKHDFIEYFHYFFIYRIKYISIKENIMLEWTILNYVVTDPLLYNFFF